MDLLWRILKIFPIPEDKNNKWVYLELNEAGFKGMEATYTKNIVLYFHECLSSNDFKTADELLESMVFKKRLVVK
jgi:hypothetical protein